MGARETQRRHSPALKGPLGSRNTTDLRPRSGGLDVAQVTPPAQRGSVTLPVDGLGAAVDVALQGVSAYALSAGTQQHGKP